MDNSLSFLPVNPVLPSVIDSTGTALGNVPPAAGEEFSALLTGQMLKAERQLFAAQTLAGTGLQVLPLGSKLKLITSNGPLPDMASLAAFARTQGIDESAIQALFSDQNDATSLASTGRGAAGVFNVAPSGTVAPLHVAPRSQSQGKELVGTITADPFYPGNPIWQIPLDISATAAADVAAASTLSPVLGIRNIAAWMSIKASAWMETSGATNPGAVSSEVALQDAMRLTITSPMQAVTQRSSQIAGSSEQSTWATFLTGNKAVSTTLTTAKVWETLQLNIPDELLVGPFDRPQDLLVDNSPANNPSQSTGHAITSNSPGSSGSAVSAPVNFFAQAEQRVIQQQQLADKLGQALAQRLVDQIERGQWKIEMRLQPESLGRIEVELKMHAGGLDALFSAENAVTRELIAQGSGKLKEALTQTGMTVAEVSVSGEQNRQSGGNSTPGNSYKPASGVTERKSSNVEGVTATVKDEPAATDGLNVWA